MRASRGLLVGCFFRATPLVPLLVFAGACEPAGGALDPRSQAAEGIATLWWVLFAVCGAVFVVVLGLYGRALLRRDDRPGPGEAGGTGDASESDRALTRLVVIGGGIVPALILTGLTVATVVTSTRLHRAGSEGEREPIEIRVTGHQYWWEVRYPGTDAVTANEIHVPVGRAARLVLESSDVIHSLWVPQLHGKIDLTPGRRTELVLAPREPGVHRGFCTEFCGTQHALMGLLVVAQPEAEFEAWLDALAQPAGPPASPAAALGSAVFAAQGCHFCHRVRGGGFPGPPAEVGPDLTHLAGRRTLGAATVPNGPDNLAAWVLDPHAIKPGVRMPATALPPDEARALMAYLESLR